MRAVAVYDQARPDGGRGGVASGRPGGLVGRARTQRLCPVPDELGLDGDHDRNHDEDLAEPAVVADLQEVAGGADRELDRDQTEEQSDGQRGAPRPYAAVLGPYRG